MARVSKQQKEAQERKLRISKVERETIERVGKKIAQARKEAGVTQRTLADHLGITETMLSSIERGLYSPYKYLDSIGELVHKDREWFLGSEEVSSADVLPLLQEMMAKMDQILVFISEGKTEKFVPDGKPSRGRKTAA